MHDTATVGGATMSAGSSGRQGHLALAFQEALTAVARLRTDRQVAADAEAFRSHLKRLLGQADASAREVGYSPETVRLAVYAVVALVDESVLASSHAIFADWPRRPLQEEVFGEHMAGAVFFDNLRSLLGQQDSEDLADVLEVCLLCLFLGFQGRYAGDDGTQLAAIKTAVSDKIVRIRGVSGELTPEWGPPAGEQPPQLRDPWMKRLLVATAATWALVLLLWVVYFVFLRATG